MQQTQPPQQQEGPLKALRLVLRSGQAGKAVAFTLDATSITCEEGIRYTVEGERIVVSSGKGADAVEEDGHGDVDLRVAALWQMDAEGDVLHIRKTPPLPVDLVFGGRRLRLREAADAEGGIELVDMMPDADTIIPMPQDSAILISDSTVSRCFTVPSFLMHMSVRSLAHVDILGRRQYAISEGRVQLPASESKTADAAAAPTGVTRLPLDTLLGAVVRGGGGSGSLLETVSIDVTKSVTLNAVAWPVAVSQATRLILSTSDCTSRIVATAPIDVGPGGGVDLRVADGVIRIGSVRADILAIHTWSTATVAVEQADVKTLTLTGRSKARVFVGAAPTASAAQQLAVNLHDESAARLSVTAHNAVVATGTQSYLDGFLVSGRLAYRASGHSCLHASCTATCDVDGSTSSFATVCVNTVSPPTAADADAAASPSGSLPSPP